MSLPRSRCCLQVVEKCLLLHPRVFGCQEGILSPSHCEGERVFLSVLLESDSQAKEANGVTLRLPPQPSPALLVPPECL